MGLIITRLTKVYCFEAVSLKIVIKFVGVSIFYQLRQALELSNMYCCLVGFLGVDCSIDAALPPVITEVRTGSLCDVRGQNPCTFISIFLTQFSFISTFSCRFVRITLHQVVFWVSNNRRPLRVGCASFYLFTVHSRKR